MTHSAMLGSRAGWRSILARRARHVLLKARASSAGRTVSVGLLLSVAAVTVAASGGDRVPLN